MSITYKDAGVNLNSADQSTQQIAALAKSTFNKSVLHDVGLFSGFFQPDLTPYKEPVLVSSIDGVGTKLKIAFLMNKHDTVGQDLVNHCVNDIMTCGADPLFFLDYIGTQMLDPDVAVDIVKGMSRACKENNCALIGGETAEMPGFYSMGEYDLAGTIIGMVDKPKIIDGSSIETGDLLLGLPSNGLHTNGYSLVRKVLLEMKNINLHSYQEKLKASWGDVLLKVHKSYKTAIDAVKHSKYISGISHITGGGLEGNTNRLLSEAFKLDVDWDSWPVPPEFSLVQQYGDISDDEMRRVFNLGIGLVFVVKSDHLDDIKAILKSIDEPFYEIGKVVDYV